MSINMIIVLIIAVVIIGLALTFVQDMLGSLFTQVEEIPDPINVPVDEANPIGFPETVLLTPGEQNSRSVRIYNTLSGNITSADFDFNVTCQQMGPMTSSSSLSGNIPVASTGKGLMIFQPRNSIQQDICTAWVGNGTANVTTKFFVEEE